MREVTLVLLAAVVGCGSTDLTPITSLDGGTTPGNDAGATTDSGFDGAVLRPGKRGLAYGQNDTVSFSADDLKAISPGISWWYNWSPKPDATLVASYGSLSIEFTPMAWGSGSLTPQTEGQIPNGTKFLLGFNEPNFKNQSNLTPEQAVALWPKVEALAKAKNLKIVSPAVNYCAAPSDQVAANCSDPTLKTPWQWMDKFVALCPTCQFDYVAFHWYACSKQALQSTVDQFKKYGKPLWLTEFACLDDPTTSVSKELAYMKDAVALLEADPMVYRYSWFTGRFPPNHDIDLFGATSGTLTDLGKQYIALPTQ
jgi:hypothetical protein